MKSQLKMILLLLYEAESEDVKTMPEKQCKKFDIKDFNITRKIKKFYSIGMWTRDMVDKAVARGIITAGEYQIITGEEYKERICGN